MEVEKKEVLKQSTKPRGTSKSNNVVTVTKNEFESLNGKLDSMLERFDGIATDLKMTNHIC
jgi:hypothetical protein